MKAKTNKRLRPLRFLQKYGRLLIGGVIIALVLFGAVFAPLLTDYDPEKISLLDQKKPPSEEHVLGTDLYGRDMLTRILYGSRRKLDGGGDAAFQTGQAFL